ncbi:probable membrane-associated kinase regulator 2 [Diospyros lotus]|uniref:probable membrane-associated kinase regulator 2 n=1 Tax=Diospyros lotus TaxID=55363 RepID=UPI00225AC27C|nr:probable membrane-associated kinase regulator 2 [Diospyros lotus]
MDAFSLLKYWRGGHATTVVESATTTQTATVVTATTGDDDDDEPFFDLEFTVPNKEKQREHEDGDCTNCNNDVDGEEPEATDSENESELKLTFSFGSRSPSDDLFFKGRLVPVEPSPAASNGSEPDWKSPFSLSKPATKLRVMMLKLKKSTTGKEKPEEAERPEERQKKSKFLKVKLKVEEAKIASLFTRNNNAEKKPQGKTESASDEKLSLKYLKMVKPLYIRVSKRYGEKISLGSTKSGPSQPLNSPSAAKAETEPTNVDERSGNVKCQKQGNIPAGLRVVCKHLGKSRSASAAAAAGSGSISANRRDDSFLEQQDGIQSAILHCKRSFNSSSAELESSLLPRSASDPSPEISKNLPENCPEKQKDSGI